MTPLVNHPRQRGTVASDMVPLWNPLLPPAGGNGEWSNRSGASKERSLMKQVQSEVFITAKPRAIGILLGQKTKEHLHRVSVLYG